VEALARLRETDIRRVMVTGRELPSLFATFGRGDLFHRIVAENGAVVYTPESGQTTVLGTAPPAELIARLERDGVPVSVGHSIVATIRPHEYQMLAALRDLGLEWHLIFNKGAVMALPADVNKATGLVRALADLHLPADAVVAVGDAENDQAFLRLSGLAVAVANALPSVQACADVITRNPRGAGVEELIARLLNGELETVTPHPANHLHSLREALPDGSAPTRA
jgi:hydroxymethylpyrimidine pyrophosphatase-like HAD family hydrolase